MAKLQRAEIPMILAGGMLGDLHWHLLVTPNVRSRFDLSMDELVERRRPVRSGGTDGGHARPGRRPPLSVPPRFAVGRPPAGVAQGHRPDDGQPSHRTGTSWSDGPAGPASVWWRPCSWSGPGPCWAPTFPRRWWTPWPAGPAGGDWWQRQRSGRGWPAGAATTARAAPLWPPPPAARWPAPSSWAARWWADVAAPMVARRVDRGCHRRSTTALPGRRSEQTGPALVGGPTTSTGWPAGTVGTPGEARWILPRYRLRQWSEQK